MLTNEAKLDGALKGFTLIELMIVVAIIAILSALSYPSYRNHVCKTERGQARADLMAFAQAMERFYTTNNFSYVRSDEDYSTIFNLHSPAEAAAAKAKYTLAAGEPTADSYTLTASRKSGSCNDGSFTLSSAGIKTWSRNVANGEDGWDE
ncbi:type IV pilus assembly protein PilE [Alteromonadaceae bacterium Bs31]|nr:type IV pilus assembly protein PilE [Alteromonadaceae bacterium Bs31]